MAEFKVTTSKLKEETDEWESIKKLLEEERDSLDSVKKSISISGSAGTEIKKAMELSSEQLQDTVTSLKKMKNVLKDVTDEYENTEKRIIKTKKSYKARNDDSKTDKEREKDKTDKETKKDGVYNYDYEYSDDDIKVPVNEDFLNKDTCMEMAKRIIEEQGQDGMCNGMDQLRIAKELYAHAVGYYSSESLINIGIDFDFIQSVSESGEVADIGLGDGLDVHYNIIWGIVGLPYF